MCAREVPLDASLCILLALFGLLFGSFANVVIWRFPRGESLSHPGSHCPVCETPIVWYDNIPVLSWIALGRRCRFCAVPISARYPMVELLSAGLWVLAGAFFGVSTQTAVAVFFFYLLLILSFIDIDLRRLPNALVGLLFVVGLVGVAVSQLTDVSALPLTPIGHSMWGQPAVAAAIGAVTASGVTLAIALIYQRVAHVEQAQGAGDVKLLAAIGLYLGPYALLALFLANVLGSIYGIVGAWFRGVSLREASIPFGPFLAVASVAVALVGPAIWGWYLALLT